MFSLILQGATTSNIGMTKENEIARIRAEIDTIDISVHDMLMHRVELAEEMAVAKDNAAAGQARMRPGREAAILRSLLARHHGPLAFPVVARIWRELINANLRVEGDFRVALFSNGGPDEDNKIAGNARSQYGDLTPMEKCETPDAALDAAINQLDTIAVFPFGPGHDWWTQLAHKDNAALKIIGCLPFVLNEGEAISSVSVSNLDREDTGDDVSLAIVACNRDNPSWPSCTIVDQSAGLVLVAVDGYLPEDDARWRALQNFDGVEAVTPIGGYANPIILSREN
jgi:chorismate mutase / prephenate dehydratase